MKRALLALCLSVLSATISAQQADPCGGLEGFALGACRGNQLKLQRQQLERQAQQDQQQGKIQEQQAENLRLQNELLRKQLEQDKPAPQPPTTDLSKSPEFHDWAAKNSWFGSDKAKTEFAMLYAKQLKQDRPDLVGRAFLDAVSAKVLDTFGVTNEHSRADAR